MGNRKSKNPLVLTDKEIKLLEKKTKMSQAEIITWHQKFLADHPDGWVDLNEFIELYRSVYPYGDPSKYASIAFKAFDSDKSGRVSFSEFLIASSFAINSTESDDLQKGLELAFDIYDSDNNKKIDRKELEQIVNALYEMEGYTWADVTRRVNEIFIEYDSNHNNSLTKDEFIRFMVNDSVASKAFSI